MLKKMVNVLRMSPGFGVVLGDPPARHGYREIRLVGAFFERFCALTKNVKDSVCKWHPSLEVEVLAALLLHVTRYSIISKSSIILPGLRASIGDTRSYAFLIAVIG